MHAGSGARRGQCFCLGERTEWCLTIQASSWDPLEDDGRQWAGLWAAPAKQESGASLGEISVQVPPELDDARLTKSSAAHNISMPNETFEVQLARDNKVLEKEEGVFALLAAWSRHCRGRGGARLRREGLSTFSPKTRSNRAVETPSFVLSGARGSPTGCPKIVAQCKGTLMVPWNAVWLWEW